MDKLDYYYLASPYNHPEERVRYKRFVDVSEVGFKLTKLGLNLFCPITQSHTLNIHCKGDEKLDHDECMRVDYALLSKAKGLIVYMDVGWTISKGVGLEIDYAHENKIPVHMLAKDDNLEAFARSILEDEDSRTNPYREGAGDDGKIESPDPILRTNKGASKAGKPNTLNFPWLGLTTVGEGQHMDGIVGFRRNPTMLYKELIDYQNFLIRDKGVTLEDANKVFVFGMQKHGLRSHVNYELSDVDDLINALGRHTLKGLTNPDEETGFPHAAHALANVLMIKQVINDHGKNYLTDEEYDMIGN